MTKNENFESRDEKIKVVEEVSGVISIYITYTFRRKNFAPPLQGGGGGGAREAAIFSSKGMCYIYRNDPRNFLYNFDFSCWEKNFAPYPPPSGGG